MGHGVACRSAGCGGNRRLIVDCWQSCLETVLPCSSRSGSKLGPEGLNPKQRPSAEVADGVSDRDAHSRTATHRKKSGTRRYGPKQRDLPCNNHGTLGEQGGLNLTSLNLDPF